MTGRKSPSDKTQRSGNGRSKKSKQSDNPSGRHRQASTGQTGPGTGSNKSDNA